MESRRKKRVYVAGPMSGYKNWNFEAFDAAAADLRSRGYEAINPVDLDREVGFDPATSSPEDFDLPAAIRRDIEALLSCQAIVMLPGHENSKGATAERHVAHWGGLDVLVYPSLVKYGEEPLLADQIPDDLWNDDGTLRVEDLEFYPDDGKPSGVRPMPEEKRRKLLESFSVEDTGTIPPAVKNVAYVPADFADDDGVKKWLGRNGVKPEDIRVVHDSKSLGDKIVEFGKILKDHQTTVQAIPTHNGSADGQTVTNDRGGKQSFISARFDCIPPEVLRLLAQCLGFGARKYGRDNWRQIDLEDNIAHAMNHLNEWNRGDRSEPHLVNAMARITFALSQAVAAGWQEKDYIHPEMVAK
jgi:hypothetical protein